MEKFTLEVTQGKYETAKEVRLAGQIPMNYYGKGVKNINFSVDYQNFRRVYLKAGRSSIINFIDENKKEFPVLVHQIQYDPVTDDIIHIDVLAVDLNKAITTEVPLVFVGQAPAVKDLSGVFNGFKDVVTIECLPKDLPREIEVSIESLVDFHSSITVADIKAPKGVKIVEDSGVHIATVSAPAAAEEEAPVVATEAEVAAPTEEKKA